MDRAVVKISSYVKQSLPLYIVNYLSDKIKTYYLILVITLLILFLSSIEEAILKTTM